MTTIKTNRKVFRRAQDIMDYYEMSRPAFEHYVQLGTPVRLINGSYHGHADKFDEWFRKMTAYSMKELQEETIDKSNGDSAAVEYLKVFFGSTILNAWLQRALSGVR